MCVCAQGGMLLNLLTTFSNNFSKLVEGHAPSDDGPVDELYGGARIGYIFNEIFTKYVQTVILDAIDRKMQQVLYRS